MLIKRATTEECRRLHDERVHGYRYDRYKKRFRSVVVPAPNISNLTGTTAATSMPLTGFTALTGNNCILTGWTETANAGVFTVTGATDNAAGGSNVWNLVASARETTNGGYVWALTSLNMKASKPTTITVTATGTITGTAVIGFWLFDINHPQASPNQVVNSQGQIPALVATQQVQITMPAGGIIVEAMANDNGSATIQAPWVDPAFHITTYLLATDGGSWTPTWTQTGTPQPSAVVGVGLYVNPAPVPVVFNSFTPGAGSVGKAQRNSVPY